MRVTRKSGITRRSNVSTETPSMSAASLRETSSFVATT